MSTSCVILLNEKAGALKHTAPRQQIERLAAEIGLSAQVISVSSPAAMQKIVADLLKEKVKKIVVSGGDGTVRLAAGIMQGSQSVLGILPQGTSNNFANALHLPLELAAALWVIKNGVEKQVSLGKLDQHYFTEAAGVGLFADALALYGKGTNKNFWRGAYSVIRLLLPLKRHRLKITLDGKTVIEKALMCTVANTFRMGSGGFPIAPDAHLGDDFLDVVIVGDVHRRELFRYVRAIKSRVHHTLPKIRIEKAQHIKIESLSGLNVHCDDQVVATTPVEIEIVPRTLRVLVEKL